MKLTVACNSKSSNSRGRIKWKFCIRTNIMAPMSVANGKWMNEIKNKKRLIQWLWDVFLSMLECVRVCICVGVWWNFSFHLAVIDICHGVSVGMCACGIVMPSYRALKWHRWSATPWRMADKKPIQFRQLFGYYQLNNNRQWHKKWRKTKQ